MSTRTLAIMFTDIKGFTARTSGESRAEIVHLLDDHDKLLRPVFAHYRGTIVKTIGDAFLVYFESPTDAVVCGVTIQEVLRKHNAVATEHDRIEIRVSINIGDVELRKDEATGQLDVFGEAVNLAARLEGITDAGEVWFTEAVYLTMNRHETPTAEVGERTFKGIPNPVRVYKVLWDSKSDQLQRIADGVKIVNGSPVLFGLPSATGVPARPPVAESHGPSRMRSVAIFAAGAVALAAGAALLSRIQLGDGGLAEARGLVDKGDYGAAVTVVDRGLAHGRNDALVAVGIRAEEALLDQKTREMPPAKALAWAREEARAHPWAAAMTGRLPELETEALLWDAIEHGAPLPETELFALFEKYPKDATVPYVAARIEERHGMPQYVLKWYETALERGGYKGDVHVRELCESTFHDFGPGAAWTATAQRIEKKFYPSERVLWAEKHLDDGNANEFLNAWTILRDERRPEPEVALRRDLHDFLAGANDMALTARMKNERDPEVRKRIAELVKSGLAESTFEPDVRDAMENFMRDLR